MDDHLEDTRQKIEQGLWYLGRISALPALEFKLIKQVNWMEAWKQHYHPIPVGRNLLILPSWIEPEDQQRIPIRIQLGMAFGTGTHPTTQMCLALVEQFFMEHEGESELKAIDIGCGSAILSIAALELGAGKALGVDIDAEAIKAARDNALLNSVSERFELGIGSVAEVRAGKFSLRSAQLVLANILAPVLVDLLEQGLGDLVDEGGWLVLSGILAEQSLQVEVASAEHGFHLVNKLQMGDWIAIAAEK